MGTQPPIVQSCLIARITTADSPLLEHSISAINSILPHAEQFFPLLSPGLTYFHSWNPDESDLK